MKNVRKLFPDMVHICYEDASGDCDLCVYLGHVFFTDNCIQLWCQTSGGPSQAWKKRLKHWTYTCTFVAFLNLTFTGVTIYHHGASLSEQHTDLLIGHCTKQDLSRTSRHVDT